MDLCAQGSEQSIFRDASFQVAASHGLPVFPRLPSAIFLKHLMHFVYLKIHFVMDIRGECVNRLWGAARRFGIGAPLVWKAASTENPPTLP